VKRWSSLIDWITMPIWLPAMFAVALVAFCAGWLLTQLRDSQD
jgi:hypothetical protein